MRHCRFRNLLTGSLLAMALAWLPLSSHAQIRVSITIAPPALPVYVQPPIPEPGYLWVPGYWAWSEDVGYYWVPGTWVEPPEPGLLWTPGYWGWDDGVYIWHEGYWGPVVGFYGGVDYGFGYDGDGYRGGYWSRGVFFYNESVNRIPRDRDFEHVYRRPVPEITDRRVSYNGGAGGLRARPTAAQMAAERARHLEPVAAQRRQVEYAGRNPDLRASINHGHPSVAATARPGQFSGEGVVPARGAPARANIAHHGAGPGAIVRRAGEAPNTAIDRSAQAGREAPIAAPHGPRPGNEQRGFNPPPRYESRSFNERPAPGNESRGFNERPQPGNESRSFNPPPRYESRGFNERIAPRQEPRAAPERVAPNAHEGRGGPPAGRRDERRPPG